MNRNSFANTVLTVSQVTQAIKQCLETEFPPLMIQGEISNLRVQSSGHCYFCLKDAQSQISAVMFRSAVTLLERPLREGDQVTALGQLNVYEPRGHYQLVVRSLRVSGLGELLVQLQEQKKRLQARGWFEVAHKKSLPPFPQCIGVVTSPTGAVIQDIVKVLQRRHAGVHLVLNPVRVQGKEAASEIAQAIGDFNLHPLADVLIVGRGGGSIEDLWAFNEEVVAQAIFESKVPIVSAVGHETDWTIADLVADVRAPTPSAAAEMVTQEKGALTERLQTHQRQLQNILRHMVAQSRQRLYRFETHPLFVSPDYLLGSRMQRCDDLRQELQRRIRQLLQTRWLTLHALRNQTLALQPITRLKRDRDKLHEWSQRIRQAMTGRLNRDQERLRGLTRHLESLHPNRLLAKGYAILFAQNPKRVISSIVDLAKGQKLEARLADGSICLTIDAVES